MPKSGEFHIKFSYLYPLSLKQEFMSFKRPFKSGIFKSVLVLFSGTVIAQGVGYLLMPLITRLYTPEDFGEFGILIRMVGVVSVIGAASYEFAIPLPKKREHAIILYRLAIKIMIRVTLLCLLLGVLYWLLKGVTQEIFIYVVFISLISGFTTFISIGQHWAIRQKDFKHISLSNVWTSTSTNIGKLLLGLVGMGFIGLSISALVGVILGSYFYLKDSSQLIKRKVSSITKKRQLIMAKEYGDFPRMDLPHNIISMMKAVVIAIILSYYFDTAFYGSFDHAYRMLTFPLLVLGVGIGQVLLNRFSEDYSNHKKIYPLLRHTLIILVLIGIIPYLITYFWGIPIFTFVFGSQWKTSGEIAVAISPWLFSIFVSSPLSVVPSVVRKLKWYFWVELSTITIQLSCMAAIPIMMKFLNTSVIGALHSISWLVMCMIFIQLLWLLRIVKKVDHENSTNS